MQDNKLYVGNLSYSVTNEKLQQIFATHGTVVKVNIIEGKGFGFVEMGSQVEAENAKKALNGTELDGRNMKVDKARPPEDKARRGGGYNNRHY
jgi:RNA recognition motif-containing protein